MKYMLPHKHEILTHPSALHVEIRERAHEAFRLSVYKYKVRRGGEKKSAYLLWRNIVSSGPKINPSIGIDARQNEKNPCETRE